MPETHEILWSAFTCCPSFSFSRKSLLVYAFNRNTIAGELSSAISWRCLNEKCWTASQEIRFDSWRLPTLIGVYGSLYWAWASRIQREKSLSRGCWYNVVQKTFSWALARRLRLSLDLPTIPGTTWYFLRMFWILNGAYIIHLLTNGACRLSPFDLVLEILDGINRNILATELNFTRRGKLSRLLNVIPSNGAE